jgi:hypothetical protein
MFNLSVLHVWFKTFGWNRPACSICQYFMSGLKHLDGITHQTWSTDKLNMQGDSIQKFWTRHEVLTNWTFRKIQSKSFESDMKNKQVIWMESPCIFNLSVLHIWFKTWMESPCMFNFFGSKLLDGIFPRRFHPKVLNRTSWTYRVIPSKFWTRHEEQTSWIYRVITSKSFVPIWFKTWMESPCMFNLFGSKLLDGIFLYVQFVSTSCLGQNFYMESHCMFNLSVLHVHWQIKHTGWLNPNFLNQKWSRQVEHTGYFHPKVLNQTWRTDNLNI